MRIKKYLAGSLLISGMAVSAATNAAFIYEGTDISGFNNLEYNGLLWNVTFNEGNYSMNYSDSSIIPEDIANLNVVLAEQIYNLGLGSNPNAFIGCSSLGEKCRILTPKGGVTGYHHLMMVYALNIGNYPYRFTYELYDTSAFDTQATWATWEVSTSPVPLPASAWLFGSGLLGLIGVGRRRCGR